MRYFVVSSRSTLTLSRHTTVTVLELCLKDDGPQPRQLTLLATHASSAARAYPCSQAS
jgi:hypothetical protein